MRKSISTQELKSKISEIVDSVHQHGDRYVIELDGKPIAAVVPLEGEAVYTPDPKKLGEIMTRSAERNRGIPAEVLDEAINQAIAEVRAEERGKRATA